MISVSGTPVNNPPVAQNDTATTSEDMAVTIAVLANDSDPDGDQLSVISYQSAEYGTVVINGDGTVSYTPAVNYNGTDSFGYTVSDGKGGTDAATVASGYLSESTLCISRREGLSLPRRRW